MRARQPLVLAPKIDDPLDTDRFHDDSCLSLTPGQVEDLNLAGSGNPAESALGGAREWRDDTTRGKVRIANGGCPVVVGVSDELTFEVDVQLSEANVGQREPCEVAADVAAMAVATMREG